MPLVPTDHQVTLNSPKMHVTPIDGSIKASVPEKRPTRRSVFVWGGVSKQLATAETAASMRPKPVLGVVLLGLEELPTIMLRSLLGTLHKNCTGNLGR